MNGKPFAVTREWLSHTVSRAPAHSSVDHVADAASVSTRDAA